MQIIIPMAGSGKRFLSAGYKNIKPLIEVDGKPIIEHVVNLFPGQEDFLFICSHEHLSRLPLKKILLNLKPRAKVVGVNPHNLGPVYSVMLAEKFIKDKEPAVVNYCDFYMLWDWAKFQQKMKAENTDGAVVCYTGFHPHLLEPNFYAGVKADKGGNILEIKEKFCYAKDKMHGWHSNGTYYFKSGKMLKKYFSKQLEGIAHENGEHYASLPFNYMIADGLKVLLHEIKYFCQWGTPNDLAEYNLWTDRLRTKYSPANKIEKQIILYWQHFLRCYPKIFKA